MRTFGDLETITLTRLQASTSVAFHTETILDNSLEIAHKRAAARHKWPFTEGRVLTTFATGTGSNADEYNFEGYKADSFRLVQIGGKALRKLNFEDYQTQQEKESDSDERVWSDFGRIVFINPSIDLSGTLTAWGQYTPEIWDVTDKSAKTVFSDQDEEGNDAVVEYAMGYAKLREKNPKEAQFHFSQGDKILDELWNRILDEQQKYQSHLSTGGRWERIDILEGQNFDDSIKRNQF